MSAVRDPRVGAAPAPVTGRGLGVTGLLATAAATAATALAAALARTAGVGLEVYDGSDAIPVSGVAVVTAFFSLTGVAMAAGFRRWSARPAERFVATTVTLTAASLVPPFLAGTGAATVTTLVVLHLLAAAVVIPALARSLRVRAGQRTG